MQCVQYIPNDGVYRDKWHQNKETLELWHKKWPNLWHIRAGKRDCDKIYIDNNAEL